MEKQNIDNKFILSQIALQRLMMGIFFIITIMLITSIYVLNLNINMENTAEQRRILFQDLGTKLAGASDYLTDEARKYAVSHDEIYLQNYWKEINVTRTRDHVIEELSKNNSSKEELKLLSEAKKHSDELIEVERHSMRLVQESKGISPENMPGDIASVKLSSEEKTLSPEEQSHRALMLLFDENYAYDKESIKSPIELFQTQMNTRLNNELYQAQHNLRNAFILQVAIAIIIIVAVAGIIMLQNIHQMKPIRHYIDSIQEIYNQKRIRIQPEGTLELYQLANIFNTLYMSLARELSHRHIVERKMKEACRKAQQANKAKSEFLANMSHEIRTPLNTIMGYYYLLQNCKLITPVDKYVTNIGIASKSLLEIINNILDFSKIEAGKMTLEHTAFNLHKLINDISIMIESSATQKGLSYELKISEDVPEYIYGDSLRLKQILLNLLSNAVKFTNSGRIGLQIAGLKGMEPSSIALKFIVYDTGIGIDEKNKEILFRAFTQADVSTSRIYGGTGLGLAISYQLILLMGSKLKLYSRIGKGTRFSFVLKTQLDSSHETEKVKKNEELMNYKFNNELILLVEDNDVNRDMGKIILEQMNLQVFTASNGEETFALIKQKNFSLILLDIRLPVMDGYEIAYRLRNNFMCKIPIVALSADTINESKNRALKAGMNDFIEKPLSVLKLTEILQKFLEKKAVIEKSSVTEHEHMKLNSNLNEIFVPENILEYFNNDVTRFYDIAKLFCSNHRKDIIKLETINLGETDILLKIMHDLKGSSANVGAVYLSKLSRDCLSKLHSNSLTSSDIDMYKNVLKDTICRIETYLSRVKIDTAVIQCKENDDTVKNLQELLVLLRNGDFMAKEKFTLYQREFKSLLGVNFYNEIKDLLVTYNFGEAYEAIERRMKINMNMKKYSNKDN